MNNATTIRYLIQKHDSFNTIESLLRGSIRSIIMKNKMSKHRESLKMADDPMHANLNMIDNYAASPEVSGQLNQPSLK